MPSVAYRHNYRRIVIDNTGAALSSGVSGNSLPVVLPDGSKQFICCGGFKQSSLIKHGEPCALVVEIEAWTSDDDGMTGWQSIPANTGLKAILIGDRVYIALNAGSPIMKEA
ncbi:hypothetical protein IC617_08255 [Neiella sp. HB171785]|uniref:Uncharacterized protein n=1 Tax=Neiella litorisoli TaxID=2771431 RepID=A0A8J6UG03_9GAMM|nr:hypothetical protein [Neiella litorisoli]MBD1389416.1 hypothetical protein [Neiella litorisoli]